MELKKIVDDLCSDAAPHVARDIDGRDATRIRLLRDTVEVSEGGSVLRLRDGGEYHTHLCRCEVCEPSA